ncbi:hypothetical protein AAVH_42031, partial [Aphelenchoides avenae]
MKRQGQLQTTLEAYFGKRSRTATGGDAQPDDDNVVVATGMAALQMIADAYADLEENQEEQEQTAFTADPADIAHDHNYFGHNVRAGEAAKGTSVVYANPEHVVHDHSYTGPSRIAVQTGGAYGFDSSEDDEPEAAADHN